MATVEDFQREIAEQAHRYEAGTFDSFFKYCSDDPRVITGIMNNQMLRFTQARVLNDPLEFNPTLRFRNAVPSYQSYVLNGINLPSDEFMFRILLIESQINEYGILSLTKLPNSFDMWSTYANGHHGFVLEFMEDFNLHPCMKSVHGEVYPVRKVEYVDDYALVPEAFPNSEGLILKENIHSELFFKKTARWQSEFEYRIVRPLSDCPMYNATSRDYRHTDVGVYLFHFDWDCVAAIIMGASMSKANKLLIAETCAEHSISLQQAHVVRDVKDTQGKPGVVLILPVDVYALCHGALTAEPQQYCTDTLRLANQDVEIISQLSELPYYSDHKEFVDQLYANLLADRLG